MDATPNPVLDGYKTIDDQIKILVEQRDSLARVIFGDIRVRLSEFATISIPEDLVFLNAPESVQRGDWSRARWELTDMATNFFRAWVLVTNPAEQISISFDGDAPVFFIAGIVAQQDGSKSRIQATLPKWVLEHDSTAIANIVRDKVKAAEAEKYPAS